MVKKYENILLVGLGGVGYYLAKRLSHEEHAITVIESDPNLIKRADGEVDARLIRGDAMSFSSWNGIDTEKMDYLIAVTDNDAVNIMSCLIADRLGIPCKIARVRSLELWEDHPILSQDDLSIDMVIRPEELTAQEISRLLKMRAGNVVINIGDGHMQVMATRISTTSVLAHTRIMDISKRYSDFYFRIVAIARGIETIIPSGDDVLKPQDLVFVLVHRGELPQLMQLVEASQEKRHRVMIIGGGLIGARVAELLEDHFPVRLLELDVHRAEQLSYRFRKTEVLHGDGEDADILLRAGLLNMDTIVTATGDNETNIMTSVLAKHLIRNQPGELHGKEGKTVALVKREAYLSLAASMGSDIVLNKKVLAGDQILKYVRRGKLLSVAHLHGVDAEVVELVAEKGAQITKKPLYALGGMKDRVIIGGVCQDEKWEIAVGDTHVQPGDKVIGICRSRHLRDLQKLLLN